MYGCLFKKGMHSVSLGPWFTDLVRTDLDILMALRGSLLC